MNEETIRTIHNRLSCIDRIIIVLSGKGGVGKSTLATQIARQLSTKYRVGVIDIDLCGPDIPEIFAANEREIQSVSKQTASNEVENVWMPCKLQTSVDSNALYFISLALMLGSKSDAVIWRGARKDAMIYEFFKKIAWDMIPEGIDYLVIDTPPGTSDEHLSLFQLLSTYKEWREQQMSYKPLKIGSVVVTTPQMVATDDAAKILSFCRSSGNIGSIPVIGLVENMKGSFKCPNCLKSWALFSTRNTLGQDNNSSNAEILASSTNVPYLGCIPFNKSLASKESACVDTIPELVYHMQIIVRQLEEFFEENSMHHSQECSA